MSRKNKDDTPFPPITNLEEARALLTKRADEIDRHMAKFPASLDRSMERTADAIRIVLSYV